MPPGEPLTVPEPVPALVTVSDKVGSKLNVALTEAAADIVTVQAPVPLHAPPQLVNTEPEAGAAARLTDAPDEKLAEQVDPHAMPAGVLVTVPAPVPGRVTDNAYDAATL